RVLTTTRRGNARLRTSRGWGPAVRGAPPEGGHVMNEWRRWLLVGLVATTLVGWPILGPAQSSGPVKLEWFSWSIFRFTSPSGKIILTNPFVTNPDSPVKVDDFPKVDVIVVADGHRDEVGSTDEIAIKTGAKIVTPFEMWTTYFEPRKVPEAQL